MYGSMVDIQSAAAEIRRGTKKKKKIEDRKKPQGKNIMSASATQGGYNHRCALLDAFSAIFLSFGVPQYSNRLDYIKDMRPAIYFNNQKIIAYHL